ncbi:MAG: hypothetical protein WAU86_07725 [Oricola sp.]
MQVLRYAFNAASAVSVACLLSSGPVFASGQILCDATDASGASIEIAVGHLPVLAVLGATATDGVETWSTNATGDQKPMVFGQGFSGDNRIVADFTDPNVERIVVSLRLFEASGTGGYAEAGVLSFEGISAFPVQCDNG